MTDSSIGPLLRTDGTLSLQLRGFRKREGKRRVEGREGGREGRREEGREGGREGGRERFTARSGQGGKVRHRENM